MKGFKGLVLAVFAGSLGACGGGSGSSGAVSGAEKSLTLGEASIHYFGQLKPAVAVSSAGVTVEGMAGANVSQFTLIPTPELKNSMVAYSQDDKLTTVYAGQTSQITGATQAEVSNPTFTSSGLLVFAGYDSTNGDQESVYTCRYDGSGFTHLFSSNKVGSRVWMFPGNAELLYGSGAGTIYTNNTSGTNAVAITTGYEPALSPNGSTIAYVQAVSGYNEVFTIPAGGGTPTQLTFLPDNCGNPTFSPDGKWVVFSVDTGSSSYIYYVASNDTGPGQILLSAASGSTSYNPCFSPDGKYILYQYSSTYPPGADTSLYTQSSGGGPQSFFASGGGLDYGMFPVWSPFLPERTFVGSGGSMFSSASGFLWSELQGSMMSVLAFTANTPGDAAVTAETVNGSASQIMHLSADSITGLKYVNSYFGLPVVVIPGGNAAVSDVLVSIDGALGTIDTIAPYVAVRGVTKPAKSMQGVNLVYSGSFEGVWSNGKNLAPNGASQVILNPNTGKLISFR